MLFVTSRRYSIALIGCRWVCYGLHDKPTESDKEYLADKITPKGITQTLQRWKFHVCWHVIRSPPCLQQSYRVCQKFVPETLDFNKTDAERPFTSFLGLSYWHAMCRLAKDFFSGTLIYFAKHNRKCYGWSTYWTILLNPTQQICTGCIQCAIAVLFSQLTF